MNLKNLLLFEQERGVKDAELLFLKFHAALLGLDLPAGIKWRLVKARRQFGERLAEANKDRVALLEEYGGKANNEKGIYDFDPPERQAEYNKAWTVMLQDDFKIDGDPIEIHMDKLEANGCTPDVDQVNALDYLEHHGFISVK